MISTTFGALLIFAVAVSSQILVVTNNSPAVLGATVTVRAHLRHDQTNQPKTSPCLYGFLFYADDYPDQFMDFSKTCSSEWDITYKPGVDVSGTYNVTVVAYVMRGIRYWPMLRMNTSVEITPFLNGVIDLYQNGATLRHHEPAFLYSEISSRIKLSEPDNQLLTRLGASFKTDWSFQIEAPCDGCPSSQTPDGRQVTETVRAWNLNKNAYPGCSYNLTFTDFHGSYVEVRARLCAVVQNSSDLDSVGNTYGFLYRRFLLLDPLAASTLANFTAESNQKSGTVVVKDDEVDALIVEQ